MLTLVAWIVAVPLLIWAGLCVVLAVVCAGNREPHHAWQAAAAAFTLACVAVCVLGFAGVVPGLGALAVGGATAFATVGCVWWEQGPRTGDDRRLGAILGDVATAAKMAVQEVTQQAVAGKTGPVPASPPRPPSSGGSSPGASGPGVVPGMRDVPPARVDPALDRPAPGEAPPVGGGPVHPAWGSLIALVAGFEPETDADFHGFFRVHTGGLVGFADAIRQAAENCGEAGTGLDPSIIIAFAEFADSVADCAHDGVLVRRRFMTVYRETLEAIQGGMRLPWKARKFLTGEDGEAA